MNRKNNAVEPTAKQLEILTGTLIADGHLRRNLSNTVYGKIEHGKKQYDYLLWKHLELNNLCSPIILNYNKDKRFGEDYRRESYSFNIKANPALETLYNNLYNNKIKRITPDLLVNYSTLSLAVHFMDDGYKIFNRYHICTDSFSIEDIILLQEHLRNNLSLNTSLVKRGFRKDNITPIYRIAILYRDSGLFEYLVRSYIIPSLKYKLIVT